MTNWQKDEDYAEWGSRWRRDPVPMTGPVEPRCPECGHVLSTGERNEYGSTTAANWHARCGWCGRYTAQPTEVVLVPPSQYSDGSTELACPRCLRLFDAGYDQCHEEVGGRDGVAEPCNRPAFDLRIDPSFGESYPVCRAHYRPPFVDGSVS